MSEADMNRYWFLPIILLAQNLYCGIALAGHTLTAHSQTRQSSTQHELNVITSLTNQAYSEYDRNNKGQSHKLFEEAALKTEAYLTRYETDPASLSYLSVLVRLAALYQNLDQVPRARSVFEQCERHPKFNSPNATLRIMGSDGAVQQSIATYVKGQLCFLTQCSNPEYRAAYELVRINGGSRGDELAPQFYISNPKRHRRSRHRHRSRI
jgi:hypothetical protein